MDISSHIFVVKLANFNKINKKEAEVGPFIKNKKDATFRTPHEFVKVGVAEETDKFSQGMLQEF